MNLRGGISGLIAGSPGTGKSTILGTSAEVPEIEAPLLLSPKPREVNSFKYRQHDVPFEIFKDLRWQPAIENYEAGAFQSLFRRVVELQTDEDHDCILLDPFTDVVSLAAHELLAVERAQTPKDMRDSRSFYGSLKYKLKDFTETLVSLSSPNLPRPKHVFVAVHTQEAKEDESGKGTEFLGTVLPMVEGGYRHAIAGEFDFVGFTRVENKTSMQKVDGKLQAVTSSRYLMQIHASAERHAKIALLPKLGDMEIEGGLPELFDLLRDG